MMMKRLFAWTSECATPEVDRRGLTNTIVTTDLKSVDFVLDFIVDLRLWAVAGFDVLVDEDGFSRVDDLGDGAL